MDEYNKGSHTVCDIKYHVISVTKSIASRLRELIGQGCEARGITIVRGSIGKDHVHMFSEHCT